MKFNLLLSNPLYYNLTLYRFNGAMEHFMQLTEHNVLDIRAGDDEFEKEFFVFRYFKPLNTATLEPEFRG